MFWCVIPQYHKNIQIARSSSTKQVENSDMVTDPTGESMQHFSCERQDFATQMEDIISCKPGHMATKGQVICCWYSQSTNALENQPKPNYRKLLITE